jgi:signal peptidase I
MARAPAGSDDDESPEEDDEDEPSRPRRSSTRAARAHRARRGRSAPVRRWSAEGDEPEAEAEDAPPGSDKPPVFWRARDSLYFGPLVALAIVVVLVASLYAYTGNWPPVYVVESGSMQHGSNDIVGLINAGDLVLAQKIPTSNIQTYADGIRSGYSTYGEYGDVLLYWPNGGGSTPIIHRALFFLQYDPRVNGFNLTDLAGLPCGNASNAVYSVNVPGNACASTDLTASVVLTLYHIGWMSGTVTLQLNSNVIGTHSGYVTMGDNNTVAPGQLLPDQGEGAWLSQIVEPSWVIGVARGMLPWFGAFKLALEGRTSAVPAQSWEWLGLTISALILLALGIHFAFRAEGIEDPRRLADDEEADDDEDPGPPVGLSRGRRILRSLRPWRSSDDEEEDSDEDRDPAARRGKSTGSGKSTTHRGRPRPRIRRSAPATPPAGDPDDEDL